MNFDVYDQKLLNRIILFTILVVLVISFSVFLYIKVIKTDNTKKWRITLTSVLIIVNCVSIGIWFGFVPNMIVDINNKNYILYHGLLVFEKPDQKTSIIYFEDRTKRFVTEPYSYRGIYSGKVIYSGKSKVLLDLKIEKKISNEQNH